MRIGPRPVARVILSLIAAVTFVSLASGCAELVPLSRAEVLGIYEAEEDGHVARVEFSGDGALRIERLPLAALAVAQTDTLDWGDTLNLTGGWYYTEATLTPYNPAGIQISLDTNGQSGIFGGTSVSLGRDGLQMHYGDVEKGLYLSLDLVERPSTPAPPTFVRANLVGQWVSNGSGSLVLRGDGTFTLEDAPLALVAQANEMVPVATKINLEGQWSFHETPLPLDSRAGPFLEFDDNAEGRHDVVDIFSVAL